VALIIYSPCPVDLLEETTTVLPSAWRLPHQ